MFWGSAASSRVFLWGPFGVKPRILRCGGFDKERQPGGVNWRRCRWCGVVCEGRRISFCSEKCVGEWLIRSRPGYLRKVVYRRDQGVCLVCRIDTEITRHRIIDVWKRTDPAHRRVVEVWMRRLGVVHRVDWSCWTRVPKLRVHSLWQADHIVPVVLGGGQCGIDNIRTLCLWCHRRATAHLRKMLPTKHKPPID